MRPLGDSSRVSVRLILVCGRRTTRESGAARPPRNHRRRRRARTRPPGPDDVLVGVGGVGLCGSDVSVFRGTWSAPEPIPGSWATRSTAGWRPSASESRATRVGELVVDRAQFPLLSMRRMRTGRTSRCLQRQSVGMNRPGGLADKVVVPGPFAWRVSIETATDLVCIEPLTVVETALSRLPEPLPASALVVGAGAQGLLMCLALAATRRRGARLRPQPGSRRAGGQARCPARHPATTTTPRFELVVDAAGTPESMGTALERVETWGNLARAGHRQTARSRSRQPTSSGVSSPSADRSPTTIRPTSVASSTRSRVGIVSPGRVATDEYPLADVQRAFESSASARGKSWIRVNPALP